MLRVLSAMHDCSGGSLGCSNSPFRSAVLTRIVRASMFSRIGRSIFALAVFLLLAGSSVWARALAADSPSPLLNLEGTPADPFHSPQAKLLVFVFARTDCPISNSYAPEIRRLHDTFASQGVAFWLVYPDSDSTPEQITTHLREYEYPCGALRDPSHKFCKRAQVTITPEVAIFRTNGELVYHGRIDNRYVDFGKARPAATERDARDALTSALAGKRVSPAGGPAVGCFIEDAAR
jgi:hypothetical protein